MSGVIAGAVLAAVSAAMVTGAVAGSLRWSAAVRMFARVGRRRDRGSAATGSPYAEAFAAERPPWRRSRLYQAIQRLAPRLVAYAGRRDIRALIASAGMHGRVESRDIAAMRVLCLFAALMAAPRLAGALPHRLIPLVLAVWLASAVEAPLWWLRRAAARRAAALRAALPDALELMRACLTAGLPLRRALLLVGDHCAEPVAGEFLCVAAETGFGIAQSTALDGLAARNPLPEVRALVAAMHRAGRHGSPLAPVIAAQAEEARRARDRAIVERGARAGPKIQLIVAATIVPAALTGLAAVVVAAFARGDLRFL